MAPGPAPALKVEHMQQACASTTGAWSKMRVDVVVHDSSKYAHFQGEDYIDMASGQKGPALRCNFFELMNCSACQTIAWRL